MPVLTPVIVRPRNASRLFATPTPGQDNDSDDNDRALSDEEKERQKKDLEATPPAYAADYTQSNNPPTDRAGGDVNRDLAGMILDGSKKVRRQPKIANIVTISDETATCNVLATTFAPASSFQEMLEVI